MREAEKERGEEREEGGGGERESEKPRKRERERATKKEGQRHWQRQTETETEKIETDGHTGSRTCRVSWPRPSPGRLGGRVVNLRPSVLEYGGPAALRAQRHARRYGRTCANSTGWNLAGSCDQAA